MAEKRELDSSSAELPLAKRIKLARPFLRKYKVLLDEVNAQSLGFLRLLLVNAWKRPPKVQTSFTFSEVPHFMLRNRLGIRTTGNNIIKSRLELRQNSKYYAVDLEPLCQELEVIYVSPTFMQVALHRVCIINEILPSSRTRWRLAQLSAPISLSSPQPRKKTAKPISRLLSKPGLKPVPISI
ncbi:uncharacterized protein BT62DRAFT_369748 [Guyanagaster necrorhizus]|uniref:Uncharacterized protein n=1 Tax=Guyanagaster necrorhizus TaxID=856835 RepID=A0A9P7VMJ3_9AGAR|nr:uncharacterized protein BT62DRAFT_369748 [Guyanagaster necrorhizus MCA 3950]KAG7442691.1 hypothetical protein BT62DRAFT_369748 [Guyanagaster necrorhizus MCA 3950]